MGAACAFQRSSTHHALNRPLLQQFAEALLAGERTTLKVCMNAKKIYFVDAAFEQRARNFQNTRSAEQKSVDAFIVLVVDEITSGRVVLANKRTDGKLHIVATKEIAEKFAKGELSLKNKRGITKEIGEVEEVSVEFFKSVIAQLFSKDQVDIAALETEKLETGKKLGQRQSSGSYFIAPAKVQSEVQQVDPRAFVQEIIRLSAQSPELDLLELQETYKILDRMRKKEQEAQLEDSDRLRIEVLKYQIRREEIRRACENQMLRRRSSACV